MLPYHPTLLFALAFALVPNGSAIPGPPDCLQGFADMRTLPVNTATLNILRYNVLPYGLHFFPNLKFLCDGSVQKLEIGLFYSTIANTRWEAEPFVDLLLSSGENYRECNGHTLNCIRIRHNLVSKAAETDFFDQCTGDCIKILRNTILNVTVEFKTPRIVKRGDYLGLLVPPLDMSFEDALPVIYTGSNYESPFIAIPPHSFIPSPNWEEQLASSSVSTEAITASADCSWATGVIVGMLLIAAVVIVILGAIIVILWRRIKRTTKLDHKQHNDCAFGHVAEVSGFNHQYFNENVDYAVVGEALDARLSARPLPELPSEVAENQTDTYWRPADTEQGIYEQLKKKRFPEIVDKVVSLERKLGEGEFGEVYRGVWNVAGRTIPMEVAVKIPKGNSEGNRIRVLQEAAILGQFNHPRVTRLCGMVTLSNPIMMVMELLPNGDLSDHLEDINSSAKNPDLPKRLRQFCLEIADGMSYLSKKGFIHRDLAARNILLDKEWHCKITDFGMSQRLDENAYYTTKGGRIPLRWTAPEAILYRKYTAKSDVWSYGMVMYEIWSLGRKPFEDLSVEEILEALRSAYCQPPPPGCPREVYEVMVECWTPSHHDRPDFPSLKTMLKKVERKATEIFHSGEDDNEAMKLGEPLEEGADMYMELQNKHRRSSQ